MYSSLYVGSKAIFFPVELIIFIMLYYIIIGYWLDMEIYGLVLVQSNIARRQDISISNQLPFHYIRVTITKSFLTFIV